MRIAPPAVNHRSVAGSHKSKLRIIYLNQLPKSVLKDPFHHVHSMLQQFSWLLDNSRICQPQTGRLTDWTSHALVNSRTGRTGQLADATGDFACLVFVFFWPFIDVFLRVYLMVYNASDSVSYGRPME